MQCLEGEVKEEKQEGKEKGVGLFDLDGSYFCIAQRDWIGHAVISRGCQLWMLPPALGGCIALCHHVQCDGSRDLSAACELPWCSHTDFVT